MAAIASTRTDPYAAIIPVLIGTGTLGIIALQAAAAIAIVCYIHRHRGEASPITRLASLLAALGLSAAVTIATANFTLLSTVSTPFVAWLPIIYPAALIAGLTYSLWLRRTRPGQYAALALVEHRASR
jgi:hypothetical protein